MRKLMAVLLLVPAFVWAQESRKEQTEKSRVVDAGTFRVSAPPGKGWEAEIDEEQGAVYFSKFRAGLLSQLTYQQRGMVIRVAPNIVNIYGWRLTEEAAAEEILSRFAAMDFPPDAKLVKEVVELGGRKLYTVRCREYPAGQKMDSIILLHFPPDFAKSHRYFDIGFQFVRGGGMLKLYNNPGLEPVEAVVSSLEIIDPLQAISGTHGELLRAAAAGDVAGVSLAIEKGAGINAGGPEEGALSRAAYEGKREIVELLLGRGAALDTADALSGNTPLLSALIGREPEIARLLIEKGANVNCKVNGGGGVDITPLMFATALGHLGIVRSIIDAGADLEARTELGESALILAADSGWTEGAVLLLERGADVNARMTDGWTALMRAADRPHAEVVGLLLGKGADVNLKASDDGRTALSLAVRAGNSEVVKALIVRGADVNAQITKSGDTPLFGALFRNFPDIARILIEAGADVNLRKEDRWTPLMMAAEKGQAEIVKLMLEKGADVNVKVDKNTTALRLAKKNNHAAIVRLLQAAGAK